jgi:hypothetical protein
MKFCMAAALGAADIESRPCTLKQNKIITFVYNWKPVKPVKPVENHIGY